jgi:DNA recombination protein RmuC
MTLDTTLLVIGDRAVTLLDLLLAAAGLGLVLLVLAVILAWRAGKGRAAEREDTARRTAELEYRLAELSGALTGFASQSQGQAAQLQQMLDQRLEAVGNRVGSGLTEQAEKTSQSLHTLAERLAVIDAAQRNITSLSTEMVSLKDILSNKQARGAFGQGRMEAIIKDGLHARAFEFQAGLSNGTRPDCLITLPDSKLKLVIDAKFPLESHSAWRNADDDHVRKAAEAKLRGDIAKHVKDISEKYLLPGETHETGIMFVPSESIYADLQEFFDDVVQKAHRARVIIASPNVLMLLVQTMQTIVKDVAMRDQAHVIKQEVSRLLEDVVRLQDRAQDLRKHFDQANTDLEKLGISATQITKRANRIEALDLEEGPERIETPQRPRLISGV